MGQGIRVVCRCPHCRDLWEYKGQKLMSITKCLACNLFYVPRIFTMLDFIFDAYLRTKGESK